MLYPLSYERNGTKSSGRRFQEDADTGALTPQDALGGTTPWGRNGLAQLSLVGHQLLLQNFDVEDGAENSTLVVEVADAVAR